MRAPTTDRQVVDPAPDRDWHGLDDDGREFLARALGEIAVDDIDDRSPLSDAPADGRLGELLDAAVAAGASDLHLCAGLPPHVRVAGVLRPLAGTSTLEPHDLENLIQGALSADQCHELATSGDLDAGLAIAGGSVESRARRFRASMFRQSGTLAAAIRVVPDAIPTLDSLGLPPAVSQFAFLSSGLVLVTGPTGSGKSTTLAAMIEEVNQARAAHIITIEDPVEYRYSPVRSVIQQREVGADTPSFATALRRALRQDPDVILLGELRDLETIQIALTAAETGHLVFATLHSANATSAVNRIIDVFPAEQQMQIRSQLALSIQGCVSQRLLPTVAGGLTPATEVMVANPAVRNLIRDDKIHQLRSTLETGADVGMHTFDQSLASLIRQRRLAVHVARGAADSVATLDAMVGS